mmetsp:Transcript_28535/g.90940  ORF Transcript_28535/g.90940 Transcript_28535/m.90940 type:complete len:207 (-) Transcript_28535:60-680(-)
MALTDGEGFDLGPGWGSSSSLLWTGWESVHVPPIPAVETASLREELDGAEDCAHQVTSELDRFEDGEASWNIGSCHGSPPLSSIRPFFNLPLKEAAKVLEVRVSTVNKWMRHHGMTRWPYRKLKSLDTLMQGLWVLVEEGDRERDEVTAVVKLLQSHRDSIENNPCLEICPRAKRIRQAVFKAQNKGRAKHAKRASPPSDLAEINE